MPNMDVLHPTVTVQRIEVQTHEGVNVDKARRGCGCRMWTLIASKLSYYRA